MSPELLNVTGAECVARGAVDEHAGAFATPRCGQDPFSDLQWRLMAGMQHVAAFEDYDPVAALVLAIPDDLLFHRPGGVAGLYVDEETDSGVE